MNPYVVIRSVARFGAVLLIASGVAHAATLHVAPTAAGCKSDAVDRNLYCSLRSAIAAANRNADADVIALEANGVYELADVDHANEGGNGLPAIAGTLRIEGNGATIRRSDAANVPPFRLLRVAKDGDLSLDRVTLRNGNTARGFDGAAIWSTGRLALTFCTLEENHSGDDGGAIRSDGVLRIADSLVRGNSARWRGGVGGGLQSSTQAGSADTIIERTTFENNEAWSGGGALWVMGTTLLVNTTLSGNRAGERGGGLLNYGSLELRNATITDNQAGVTGGGLFTYGPVSLGNTLLSGNRAMIASDCQGKLVSLGYNQIGNSYRCTLDGDATGNVAGGVPALAPIADVGGVRAHEPRTGGTLIDAGNPAPPGSADAACDRVDQRNHARAGRCDIGAIEHGTSG